MGFGFEGSGIAKGFMKCGLIWRLIGGMMDTKGQIMAAFSGYGDLDGGYGFLEGHYGETDGRYGKTDGRYEELVGRSVDAVANY